jgi:uncharacterized protein involved in exopolysaccharide biosynthesis
VTTVTRPREPELDAEQEVELGRYWRRIAARWWLLLAGLVAGAAVGYLLSLGGNDVWKASSVIYLGTPYSTGGNTLLPSAQTNPATVRAIVTSEDALARAAGVAGMRPQDLSGKVSTQTVSTGVPASTAARLGQTPEVRVTVEASSRRKATVAANSLARSVVENPAVAGYVDAKITNLRQQIARVDHTIGLIDAQLARGGLSPTIQLLLQLRLDTATGNRLTQSGFLTQAQLVEKPRVLTRAAAVKSTARSRRNSVVVGAFLGLLLGIAAALAWEPFAARRR